MLGLFKKKPITGVNITTHRERVPEFKRTYSKVLESGHRIEIDIHILPICQMQSCHGRIIQNNDYRAWFDPERVPETVFDPVLVPEVVSFSKQAIQLDKEFRKSKPDFFIDVNGATWVRHR